MTLPPVPPSITSSAPALGWHESIRLACSATNAFVLHVEGLDRKKCTLPIYNQHLVLYHGPHGQVKNRTKRNGPPSPTMVEGPQRIKQTSQHFNVVSYYWDLIWEMEAALTLSLRKSRSERGRRSIVLVGEITMMSTHDEHP
mmetsp:Transcript_34877/g.61292  ORF Transcript_34877/g.61292 Transcript_34877/m.61292 type:complete len:142 (+) Transcript_34877:270-695(+)